MAIALLMVGGAWFVGRAKELDCPVEFEKLCGAGFETVKEYEDCEIAFYKKYSDCKKTTTS